MQTVASLPNLCSYVDTPLQHISGPLLQRMGRPYDPERIVERVRYIRSVLPQAALRTTVIVGFPGETDKDFEQLQQLIETVPFDHLGVFTYSDAEDLASHRLPDHVPAACRAGDCNTFLLMLLKSHPAGGIDFISHPAQP